jgi:hypothetical protein
MAHDYPSLNDAFAPPPAAFPPPPRLVRLRSVPWVAVVVLLFLSAAAVGLCPVTILPLTLSVVAKGVGVLADGEITKKRVVGRTRVDHLVQFQFDIDGRTYHSEVHVDPQAYSDVKVGDPIRVRALTVWPSMSASIEEPAIATPTNVWAASCFTIVLTGVTALVIAVFVSQARRRRWLAMHGTPATGRITSKQIVQRKGSTYRLIFAYSTESDGGATAREASMDVTKKQYNSISTGQRVTVLYDPDKPWSGMVYCFSGYRVVEM